jgi:hypothetical protein
MFPSLWALPRFAIKEGYKCQNCHIDPNGGGMRNYYGAVMYARATLPRYTLSEDSIWTNFTNQLNSFVSIGADFRTIYVHKSKDQYSTFYQMQSDISLAVRLSQKLLLYLNKDVRSGFEAFAMASVLPENGYVKVGRFTPAFGTRVDDHTSFIRSKTVFPYYRREDTGLEIGISPTWLTWNIGIYNGDDGSDPSNGKIRLVTSRVEVFYTSENIKLAAGGSIWQNNAVLGRCRMVGLFAAAAYGDVTLHSEIDFKNDAAVLGTEERVSFVEINYKAIQGLELKLMYDFYDPDITSLTGTETRISVGAEVFPVEGFEIRPMFRLSKKGLKNAQENQFDLMLHFYL